MHRYNTRFHRYNTRFQAKKIAQALAQQQQASQKQEQEQPQPQKQKMESMSANEFLDNISVKPMFGVCEMDPEKKKEMNIIQSYLNQMDNRYT